MQIQMHVEGETLRVSIPVAGGAPLEQVLPLNTIDNSDRGNPATVSFADPHPSVGFARPVGERPLFEQEALAKDHNAIAMNMQRRENPDLLEPPNSAPEQKTVQDAIRGPGATAQIGMTARELTGEVPEEGDERPTSAGIATNLPITAFETSAERPAASLPDSKTPGSEMPEAGVMATREDLVQADGARKAPETLDGEEIDQQASADKEPAPTSAEQKGVGPSAMKLPG